MEKLRSLQLTKEARFGILLILPALIILAIVYIYPLIYNVDLSLSRWNLAPPTAKEYIGLQNYEFHFSSDLFHKVLGNTLFFTVLSVPIEFFAGLGLALLLNKNIKGKNAIITILALPMMIAPVVGALSWRWLYAYDYGALNYLLSFMGIKPILWIADSNVAMYSVIIADAWITTPFMMLIIYAGLKMIPEERYEAARIDGASSWQMFRYVTLPSLKSVLLVALMIRSIDAFTKIFDVVYVITGGGPVPYDTEVLPTYTYKVGLRFFRLGSGAALAMITLMITVIMIAAMMRVSKIAR